MIGQKLGYYDASDWKSSYYCDVIVDQWSDMLKVADPFLGGGTDEEKLAAAQANIDTCHEQCFTFMEKQLETLGTPYIAGNKLSIADCIMSAFVHNMYENPNGPLAPAFAPVIAKYPKVTEYFGRLKDAFKEVVDKREDKFPM